jgi:hypothetical protein
MKQLIKELIYRTIYTTIALSTIMGFIYLNYACQMEYVWSVYHMDSECIDFWFPANQGQKKLIELYSPKGYTLLFKDFAANRFTSLRFEWWGFFLNVIHDVLNQQSVHGF